MADFGEPSRRSLSSYRPPRPPQNLVDRVMEAVARGETESSRLTVKLECKKVEEEPASHGAGFDGLVSVTLVPQAVSDSRDLLAMLEDEVLVSAGLVHPNISRTFGLKKGGLSPVLAVELVYGATLDAILDKARAGAKPIPVDIACSIIAEVCRGLDHAHHKVDDVGRELNLVHHGVTPKEISISYEGEVKVSGFGLAKVIDRLSPSRGYRARYLSPEQVSGHPLDQRSDIFAVGVTLFELLTGENPFESASSKEVLDKVRNVEVVPPSTLNPKIPEELEQVIFKALSPTPEFRYQRASELGAALEKLAISVSVRAIALASWVGKLVPEEKLPVELGQSLPRRRDGTLPVVVPPPPPRRAPSRRPPAPPPVPRRLSPPPPPKVPTRPPPLPPLGSVDRVVVGSSGPPDEMESMTTAPWSKASLEVVDSLEDELPPPSGGTEHGWRSRTPSVVPSSLDHERRDGEHRQLIDPAYEPAVFVPELPSTTEPSRPQRAVTVLMVVAFVLTAVLLSALVYHVALRPGTIVGAISSLDAVVNIDGRPVPLENGRFEQAGLRPGRHRITVYVGGAEIQNQEVDVGPGGTVMVLPLVIREERPSAAPPRRKTGVAVAVVPEGATIAVDGVERPEKTPTELIELAPGSYLVRLEKEGYEPLERAVVIGEGVVQQIDGELTPATTKITLHLTPGVARCVLAEHGQPDRRVARVFDVTPLLGPKLRCSARDHDPLLLELGGVEGPAKRSVVVKLRRTELLASAAPARHPVETDGADLRLPSPEELLPAPSMFTNGFLSVNTVPWSKVFVNGRFIGNTPVFRHELPPGSYEVHCLNPQYAVDFTQPVSIVATEERRLVKRLAIGLTAEKP